MARAASPCGQKIVFSCWGPPSMVCLSNQVTESFLEWPLGHQVPGSLWQVLVAAM